MKLTMKLDEINYGDVAVRAMPLLAKSVDAFGAVEMIVAAVSTYLPEDLIRSVFDAIPEARKNEIIAQLALEHKDRILRTVNELSEKYKIGVNLKNLTVDRDLTVVAEIGRIDYTCIVGHFLPVIREKLLALGGMAAILLRPVIQNANAEQIVGLMDRFVSNKDDFFASIINQNQERLIGAIEDVAQKQNIRMKIHSVFVEP